MGLPEARKALTKARSQLERVQVAGFDPPDPVEAVTFGFYAYENAVVAAAEAKGIKWTKNHYEKAKLARKLCDDAILATNVEDRLLQLNDLRKDVAYGEPGPELEEVDLEDLASDLEQFIERSRRSHLVIRERFMTRRTMERGLKPIGLNWRRSLLLVFQDLRESGLLKDSLVILTGSYAQGCETPRSDIDVLVIRRGHKKGIRAPYGVHFKFEDLQDFRRRLAEGDDFVIDALKFGELLHDGLGLWEVLRNEMTNAKWPDWRVKIGQAERRIRLAEQLLKLGDLDAAAEEYVLTATQVARARLLRKGVFPMSRPQLSDQLLAIGEADLAGDLEELIEGDCGEPELRTIGLRLRSALDDPKGAPTAGP